MRADIDQATALYRFFNPQRQLLYIGIAFDPNLRARQHAVTKAWWAEVDLARTTIEWFLSRSAAEAAELAAIRAEGPRYNIVTSDGHGCARFLPRPDGGSWGRPAWTASTSQERVLNDLASAATQLRGIDAAIETLTLEAADAGIPISWIAEHAAVTRKTVYRHLGRPMK